MFVYSKNCIDFEPELHINKMQTTLFIVKPIPSFSPV